MGMSLEDLAQGVLAGQRPALARALSLAERDAVAAARLMARLAGHQGSAHVIGITGPPGAGKSTLVGALVRTLLEPGRRIAVLAVDPSSPVSGGALLGDRFRIGEALDGRCFVRSTATRGSLGGLTAAARNMVTLMDLAGHDLVIVETVGTGQSEIDVAHLADTLLVAFPPGLGDEMQAIKAGILELADLLVVTKADTPAAGRARDSLRAVTHLWRHAPPIHAVSATGGEGIAELAAAILERADGGYSSKRGATMAGRSLETRFAALWAQVQATVPTTAGLQATVSAQATDALQVELAPTTVGNPFLLGTAAGAIAMLAGEQGLRYAASPIDLQGSCLRFTLTTQA